MSSAKTSAPFPGRYDFTLAPGANLDEASVQILRDVGIVIHPSGYNRHVMEGPQDFDLFMNGLSALSGHQLRALAHTVDDTPEQLVSLLRHAMRFRSLEHDCNHPDPAYPLGGLAAPPFTVAHDDKIRARFDTLLDACDAKGITLKFGTEFEFAVEKESLQGFDSRLSEIIRILGEDFNARMETANEDEQVGLWRKLQHITQFTTRDVMMMYLLEHVPATKDFYQYAFGHSNTGNGYYDNDDILELKSKMRDARGFFPPYLETMRAVMQTIWHLRLPFHQIGSQHLSFSAWKDGRNVLLGQTPEDRALTERIARAAAHLMDEGLAASWNETLLGSRFGDSPIMSPSRNSILRFAHGRIEMRQFVEGDQHVAFGALLAAGAVAAAIDDTLYAEIEMKARPLKPVLVAHAGLPDDALPWLRHAINGSTLDPETMRIQPDMPYLHLCATKILAQMFPDDMIFRSVKKPGKGRGKAAAHFLPASNPAVKGLADFLSDCRLVRDGDAWKPMWDKHAYDFSPMSGVDAEILERSMTITGVETRYVYDGNDTKLPDKTLEQTRAHRFTHSSVLPRIMGDDLFASLARDVRTLYPDRQDINALYTSMAMGIQDGLMAGDFTPDARIAGNGMFTVPIEPTELLAARQFGTQFMDRMREHKDLGLMYRILRLTGIQLNEDQTRATGYIISAPLHLLQQITPGIRASAQAQGAAGPA